MTGHDGQTECTPLASANRLPFWPHQFGTKPHSNPTQHLSEPLWSRENSAHFSQRAIVRCVICVRSSNSCKEEDTRSQEPAAVDDQTVLLGGRDCAFQSTVEQTDLSLPHRLRTRRPSDANPAIFVRLSNRVDHQPCQMDKTPSRTLCDGERFMLVNTAL